MPSFPSGLQLRFTYINTAYEAAIGNAVSLFLQLICTLVKNKSKISAAQIDFNQYSLSNSHSLCCNCISDTFLSVHLPRITDKNAIN